MEKNIQLKVKTPEGYDKLFPKTKIRSVEGLEQILNTHEFLARLYGGVIYTVDEVNALNEDPGSGTMKWVFCIETNSIWAILGVDGKYKEVAGKYLGITDSEIEIADLPKIKGLFTICKENNSIYYCSENESVYTRFSVDDKLIANINLLEEQVNLSLASQGVFYMRMPNGGMRKVSLAGLVSHIQNPNFLGYFNTPVTLPPVASAGNHAIVGSTDTLWVWDTDTGAWIDSNKGSLVTSVNGQIGDVIIESTKIVVSEDEPELNQGEFWYEVVEIIG